MKSWFFDMNAKNKPKATGDSPIFFRLIHQKPNTRKSTTENSTHLRFLGITYAYHISQTLYTIDFQTNQKYEKIVMAKQDIEISTELL